MLKIFQLKGKKLLVDRYDLWIKRLSANLDSLDQQVRKLTAGDLRIAKNAMERLNSIQTEIQINLKSSVAMTMERSTVEMKMQKKRKNCLKSVLIRRILPWEE